MSDEHLDPRMEDLFREAQGREDVFRFHRLLRDVASEVEAREVAGTPVIPLWRRPAVRWVVAAAVVAIAVVGIALPYLTHPDMDQLAMTYARASEAQVRGEGGATDALANVREALLAHDPDRALDLMKAAEPASACDTARLQWFTALARLMQHKESAARTELEKVKGSGCQEKDLARELLEEL
ncbi:MAG: hypothetical protein H6595_10070 [Flavobacteriales bacterium]|nr:hypothetical protein [Flavobacteriales bacterium]MCB9167807.1 hypothetical protein [Flavobacteriales bacterium]